MTSEELDRAVLGTLDGIQYTETGRVVLSIYPHLAEMGRTTAFTRTDEYKHVLRSLQVMQRYRMVDQIRYRETFEDERTGRRHNVLRCAWRLARCGTHSLCSRSGA